MDRGRGGGGGGASHRALSEWTSGRTNNCWLAATTQILRDTWGRKRVEGSERKMRVEALVSVTRDAEEAPKCL